MPTRPLPVFRIVERIDHREPVAQHVGERDAEQRAGAAAVDPAVRPLRAVLDQLGLDMAVLDHHGVVEHGHVGHAAVEMAVVQIGAEHRILLGGRHRHAHLADQIGVGVPDAAHAARRPELIDDHADRNAGAARLAGRAVGDRLAAAEAAMGEQVVEVARAVADEVREDLALLLARQIRAG